MMALIGECGLMAGRMTPITPEDPHHRSSRRCRDKNVMPTILVSKTLVTIVFSIVLFIIFKGCKVKKSKTKQICRPPSP